MKKLRLQIELHYDDVGMHGKDEESYSWFLNHVLEDDLILHSNLIGDTVGYVTVVNINKDT